MKVANIIPQTQAVERQVSPIDQLEQSFLEEVLKYSGIHASDGAFSGGHGEEQFQSMMTQEYAAVLAKSLDLGLAVDFGKGSA